MSSNSSIVIENLCSLSPDIGIACLYGDYKDKANQTLVHILGGLLHQFLTTSQKPIPDKVTQKLQDIRFQCKKIEAEDNFDLLKTQLQQLKRAFICIDAIDELEPKVRRQLLDVLKRLSTHNTRLFLTGRGHVENEVEKYFQVAQDCIVNISASDQDIQEFVRQQIKEGSDQDPEAMDEVLAKEIEDAIVKRSQGMYVPKHELGIKTI